MQELVTQERVSIATTSGRLSGQFAYPESMADFACLLVNPHPLMGGGMGNNVIKHLSAGLAGTGGVVLSFDYSGVGASQGVAVDVAGSMQQFWQTGHAPEDPARIDEALAAMRWLRKETDLPLFLIGYSFGAAAATALLDERVAGIGLISPTIVQHAFPRLSEITVPKLIIYSDGDFATPPAAMAEWLEPLGEPKTVRLLPGAGHFYRGCEADLIAHCERFIRACLDGREETQCPA